MQPKGKEQGTFDKSGSLLCPTFISITISRLQLSFSPAGAVPLSADSIGPSSRRHEGLFLSEICDHY